jgi:hypothetical protein
MGGAVDEVRLDRGGGDAKTAKAFVSPRGKKKPIDDLPGDEGLARFCGAIDLPWNHFRVPFEIRRRACDGS